MSYTRPEEARKAVTKGRTMDTRLSAGDNTYRSTATPYSSAASSSQCQA